MVKCVNHYIIVPEVREIGSRHKILVYDDQAMEQIDTLFCSVCHLTETDMFERQFENQIRNLNIARSEQSSHTPGGSHQRL